MKQLTKSDFLSFLEAPMHLWAKKNFAIKKDMTTFNAHLIKQGYEVEKLAKQYLKLYISENPEYSELIWQKSYCYKNYQIKIDALLYNSNLQTYDIYEIKSSTSIKKENLSDVTFQYLILKELLPIINIYILHLDKDYIRQGELNIQQLFIAKKVNKEVYKTQEEINKQRKVALEIIQQPFSAKIATCNKPKSCPCPELCHPQLPDFSIYNIPRLHKTKIETLKQKKILAIKDIPDDFDLSDKQLPIVSSIKSGYPILKRKELKDELSKLMFPLYFLDYETYNAAIPLFDKYKPQQQIIFQYSLHIVDSPNSPMLHYEFLALDKNDPCPSLLESLKQNIEKIGSIIVWNKAFEITRNKEMALRYPKYADFLNELNNRIYDLSDPINNGLYIHPGFKGSWSIKNVLPIMASHLSYKSLDIQKGDEAMLSWWSLTHGNINNNQLANEQQTIAKSLLEYCKLDTLAMVEIWNKFNKL
jgi:hypothetical protein